MHGNQLAKLSPRVFEHDTEFEKIVSDRLHLAMKIMFIASRGRRCLETRLIGLSSTPFPPDNFDESS